MTVSHYPGISAAPRAEPRQESERQPGTCAGPTKRSGAAGRLDVDRPPSLNPASVAYRKALDALSGSPGLGRGQLGWLARQNPVGIDAGGCVVLGYPSRQEARRARSSEAMARLGRALRRGGLAAGVRIAVAGPEPASRGTVGGISPRGGTRPGRQQSVYMPAFLVATTLPHTDPNSAVFTRVNGKVRTTLRGEPAIGLPYGIYARLILMQLTTTAVRTGSQRVVVGRSVREFLARMEIGDGGGGRGEAARAREQMGRLCATTFTTTHLSNYGGRSLLLADEWMKRTPVGQVVVLARRFFEQATRSPVPLDPAVLAALRRSPLAIDIYGWVSHGMATLEKPASISWRALEKQFGSEYRHPRQFRWKFGRCLERVRGVWRGAGSIELSDRSITLDPGWPGPASSRRAATRRAVRTRGFR